MTAHADAQPMNEEAVFLEALQKSTPEERAVFLDAACASKPELRRGVELLLKAVAKAGSFLESPVPAMVPTVDELVSERPGTIIGPYKLLQQLGEGGMGTVFMAEQTEPIQRKVALKVIKPVDHYSNQPATHRAHDLHQLRADDRHAAVHES